MLDFRLLAEYLEKLTLWKRLIKLKKASLTYLHLDNKFKQTRRTHYPENFQEFVPAANTSFILLYFFLTRNFSHK